MPVPISNVTRRVVLAASGTGPYSFTFEILANTDISVYRDDTLLTLTTDYTVTINSNGTGYVTLTATPTGATQIAIVGNRAIQRTSDFVTGGDLFANTINDELDSLTIFAQQNAEGIDRALKAPQTDPTTIDMTIPSKTSRANKYLGFDADGNPVATTGTSAPASWGTMSEQNANNVSITGGTVSGTTEITLNTNKLKLNGSTSGTTTLNASAIAGTTTITLPDQTSTLGFINIPKSGSNKTTAYTLQTSDVGEYIEVGSGGSIVIPDATFSTGDAISIFNNTSSGITITCSITTAYISGTDSDKATMTLATRGVATILFISSTVCVVSGSVT